MKEGVEPLEEKVPLFIIEFAYIINKPPVPLEILGLELPSTPSGFPAPPLAYAEPAYEVVGESPIRPLLFPLPPAPPLEPP